MNEKMELAKKLAETHQLSEKELFLLLFERDADTAEYLPG